MDIELPQAVKDKFFNTPENIERNVQVLEEGAQTPFWNLLTSILDIEIETLSESILSGDNEPEVDNRLKDARKKMKELRDLPRLLMAKVRPPKVGDAPSDDPFETRETMFPETPSNQNG